MRLSFCRVVILLMFAMLFLGFHANSTAAKDLPADLCSLLTPAQLNKMLGRNYDAPEKGVMPPVYMGQSAGTTCNYHESHNGRGDVNMIVYVDHSPDEAKKTFNSLGGMFPAASRPTGIGDSAYIDKSGDIHVLKGKVRYFISASHDVTKEKLKELATAVAGEI